MRRFFSGLGRVIAFPFILLFNVLAFPFRLIFNIVAFPFRALYRRFPKFFNGLWRVISFPFRLLFNIVAFPFRAVQKFHRFLNTEPEERPLTDVVADLITSSDTRQMMWDQVEDLRMHILRSAGALLVAVCASFFFTEQVVEYLALPAGGLNQLKAIDPTESIGVFMLVALLLGVMIAVPYIAFELWLFAAPGLRPHERKLGLIGIPLAGIFFAGGVAFTFYVMLPTALPFLTSFMGIKTEMRPQSYFSFIIGLMFWIGLSFEFPLVIYVLTSIGILEPKVLAQQWRLAIVIIAIVAAVITPTVDFVNQGLVMAPLVALYFLSIGLSYIAHAGRQKSLASE